MRYVQITPFEVCNGKGAGVSLFVQGCPFHCKGCFNPETWSFEKGKEWTDEIENTFFELIDQPYIKRISILGGEPLADENVKEVLRLTEKIWDLYGGEKEIWLYTGYKWDDLFSDKEYGHLYYNQLRRAVICNSNVMIDGTFVHSLKNLTLQWRGSSNQRVIDVRKSLMKDEIILYKE